MEKNLPSRRRLSRKQNRFREKKRAKEEEVLKVSNKGETSGEVKRSKERQRAQRIGKLQKKRGLKYPRAKDISEGGEGRVSD